MRGLRTVPALLSVAKNMSEVCPSATMLQYVNPMAINCLALSKFAPELKYVGLCHSVQGTAEDLAKDIGEDIKTLVMNVQVSIICLFILSLKKLILMEKKENLYPKIFKAGKEKTFGTNWDGCTNEVRYKVLEKFGYLLLSHLNTLQNILLGLLKITERTY